MRTLRVVGTSTLSVASVHQLSRLSQRSLSVFVLAVSLSTDHAPESPLRLSLNSRSTVAFIRSLHANYCNQTQVFLILHLTHLLTTVSCVFLPLQTSLNHAPPATYPHRPTQAGKPSGLQPPPPPFLERKSHSWRGSRPQSSTSPACGSP